MTSTATLSKILQLNQIESTFSKGKKNQQIKDLQKILFELGFAEELEWKKYGADGTFGNCTAKALVAFGIKNDIATDGLKMSADLTAKIIERHELLSDLRQLNQALEEGKIATQFSRSKSTKEQVIVLQSLIAALGFSEELGLIDVAQIPNGIYDDRLVSALKSFGENEVISTDGQSLSEVLGQRILDNLNSFYGKDWIKASALFDQGKLNVFYFQRGSKTNIRVFDGIDETNFIKFRKGLYTLGTQDLSRFLKEQNKALISEKLPQSALNILTSVAENEGNLDAINTYDNSFLSFGIFQWTLGAKNNTGELPALLKKLKEADSVIFDQYFGNYGIDVSSDTNKTYGYLTQSRRRIKSSNHKEKFRKADWAFRFWKAGQNDIVKRIQTQHAFDRLHTFYWTQKAQGTPLSQMITSEYGVALILDNHVNRPGYVRKCIAQAMSKIGLIHPPTSTEDEQLLLNAYLDIRKTYGKSPMTHAEKRAKVTQRYLKKGVISSHRGSFDLGMRSRGMKVGSQPSFIDLDEFEEIRDFDSS